jgi:peptidoglycan hydrolase-like protein with peptidoglycan-binding domain
MLCTRFLAEARWRVAMGTALLLAILVLPSGASASDHTGPASAEARGSAAIMRFGDGYSRSTGSRSVRWIQRRLDVLGYATGPIDGRFGPLTQRAVSRFQASHHLRIDGDVGPITSSRLRRATALVRFGTGYAQPHGSRRVRAIQRRLRELGYAPGPSDGRFGPLTQRAVIGFQADHRLAADGEVGRRTYARLRPQPVTSPSTDARVEERDPVRPPAISDLRTAKPPPAARALARHAPLPHGPPAEAVLMAVLLVGLAVFAGSYLHTRARLAEANRGPRGASIADANGERAR